MSGVVGRWRRRGLASTFFESGAMELDHHITRQSTHFPLSHLPGESTPEYQARLSAQLFQFSDPLLAAVFQHQSEVDGLQVIGTTNTKYCGSHVLLTLLVRRALHLYRLPFHEDRCLTDAMRGNAQRQFAEIAKHLTTSRIEAMTREVAALYAHTQRALADAGLMQVRLQRHLDEPQPSDFVGLQREKHHIYGLVKASGYLGKSDLELEMDTLNSFSDDGGYAGRPIHLTLDIPASNVLYCTSLLGTAGGSPSKQADVEPGEWVVINRAIDGVVPIPLTSVQVRERELELHERFDNREYCETFLRDYGRAYLRPSAAPQARTFRGISYREKPLVSRSTSRVAQLLKRLRLGTGD
jgi:hypothetical protein